MSEGKSRASESGSWKRLKTLYGRTAAVIVVASCRTVIRTSVLATCVEISGDQTLGLPKNLLLQDARAIDKALV
jgi:hypothetical protein